MPAHATTSAHTGHSPLERALVAWLIALIVTGGPLLWAMYSAAESTLAVVAWGGGALVFLLCAAFGFAFYYSEIARSVRRQSQLADAESGRLAQELARVSEETLPALLRRIQEGVSAESALAELTPPASIGLQRVLYTAAFELGAAEQRGKDGVAAAARMESETSRLVDDLLPVIVERVRAGGATADSVLAEIEPPADEGMQRVLWAIANEIGMSERGGRAAMAACASAAARIQAQTTRILADLRDMEDRYSEDKVFGDLLDLDHRVSQMGRLADSIALLSGGRSGRRWTKPIKMESILRGAMGRIDAYRRIRLHSTSTVAVVGHAAEGVMHTIAELMDNAATFSAHGTEVHVYMEEEDAGAVILIEDGGLGMRKRERNRAETLVAKPLDLTTLSGTRLGLAVVGRLADKYGLTVSFRPSSRGGTGVVVMVPRQLITQQRPDPGPVLPRQARPAEVTGPTEPEAAGDWAGMPRRRRGATLAAATRAAPPGATEPVTDLPASGARFAAFRRSGEPGSPAPDTE
jgi:signal transduction histidine kinase